MSSCDVSVCPVGHRDEEEEKISIDFCSQRLKKNNYFVLFFTFYYFLEENILFNYNLHVIFSWCQIVRFIMLVPNCPGAKLSGAKLSVFIMLVPNCPGAKLSGAKLSWCQIVLVPNCPVPNCPVPNCPTTQKMHTR